MSVSCLAEGTGSVSHNVVLCSLDAESSVSSVLSIAGYTHNPYNGVVCNDTILATGVFSSKELWRLSKGT